MATNVRIAEIPVAAQLAALIEDGDAPRKRRRAEFPDDAWAEVVAAWQDAKERRAQAEREEKTAAEGLRAELARRGAGARIVTRAGDVLIVPRVVHVKEKQAHTRTDEILTHLPPGPRVEKK